MRRPIGLDPETVARMQERAGLYRAARWTRLEAARRRYQPQELFDEGLGDWWEDLKAAGGRVLEPVINTAKKPIEEAAQKSALNGAFLGVGAGVLAALGFGLLRGRR